MRSDPPVDIAAVPVSARVEQKRRTRERLVRTARELFVRDGYTETRAEAIARGAGVSRATFYLHFRNKAEIVVELMHGIEPEVTAAYQDLDAMVEPTRDDVVAWLERHADMWRRYRAEYAAMEQALANEAAVADDWYAMHSRVQALMVHLMGRAPDDVRRARTKAHVMSLMMSMDRSFYFLIIRGFDDNYHDVVTVLAEQWHALLRKF